MIASIFQFLLNILNFIVLLIVRLILSFFPSLGLEQLSTALDTFFGLMTGALNFTYFMLGEDLRTKLIIGNTRCFAVKSKITISLKINAVSPNIQ